MRKETATKIYQELFDKMASRGIPEHMLLSLETLYKYLIAQIEMTAMNQQDIHATKTSVIDALGDSTDFEGKKITGLNYLQGIHKLIKSERLGNEVIIDQRKQIESLRHENAEAYELLALWLTREESDDYFKELVEDYFKRVK